MSDDSGESSLPASKPMPASGWADPPKGWKSLVARTDYIKGDAPAVASLTRALFDQLWAALGKACLTPYTSDLGDIWEPDWEGDCEDKCLAMRDALVAEGWPLGALRLCLCETETGEAHCVLTAETDRGVFVLDERARGVVSWQGLPYTWLAREFPGFTLWQKIPASAAND